MSTPLRSVRVRTDVTRVLVVTAHPDDVDFAAAGTVATWTAAGIETAYCICTSGNAGGFDETPRHEMGPLREAEQRAAAKEVGLSVPLVVRMEGTNVEQGKKILADSGLDIITAGDMLEGAEKAVAAVGRAGR